MISSIKRYLRLIALCLSAPLSSHAQDTVRITLHQAEDIFLQHNLSLLAERYNIDMAKASVLQARLYNNPNIAVSGNIYNPALHKPFDLSNETGQYTVDVQQVIILAGKRNKQIKLARTGAALAEHAFFDLLRTLRFTLRSDFYKAYYQLNSINAYQVQIESLERLSATFGELQSRGAVTLKDALRIKSLLYSLKAEQTSIRNDFNDVQSEIRLLLQNNHVTFVPVIDGAAARLPAMAELSLQALVDTAYVSRQDLKMSRDSLVSSTQNLALQKALAVPDITVGGQFDKRGNFVDNASFFTASMDLPLFGRNQGNIRAARLAIDQSKVRLDQQRQIVENEVRQAYTAALNTEQMLGSVDPGFRGQFEQLLKSITQNFERRNISLLEFADFYDSYKENILQLNKLESDRMQSMEQLNYAVGKTVINF